jgi:hypothetical protein
MRCFIPATDDEIYAMIERHGFGALVAYRYGMRLGERSDEARPAPPSSMADRRFWSEGDAAPRQAA